MIFLYRFLQSENKNINLGGASERFKNSSKMLHWWVGGADLSTFDYLYRWSRYMATRIVSVDETVLVYNLSGASSSK